MEAVETFHSLDSPSPVCLQAIRHVQTMYEEAYNDYLRDRARGNGTLMTFHSTVSNCFFLENHTFSR